MNGAVCDNLPVRQDLLDELVWGEVIRLLEDPKLVQAEIDRRLAAVQAADPMKKRENTLRQELIRIRKRIDRLVSAYQEELISIEELRERITPLRQNQRATESELDSVCHQTQERANALRLAETLNDFLSRLRTSAQTLDVEKRQQIVRLLVKEVLVGDDVIVIRHSIPISDRSSPNNKKLLETSGGSEKNESYLLRTWSHISTLCK